MRGFEAAFSPERRFGEPSGALVRRSHWSTEVGTEDTSVTECRPWLVRIVADPTAIEFWDYTSSGIGSPVLSSMELAILSGRPIGCMYH